jgi:hypothetical protein
MYTFKACAGKSNAKRSLTTTHKISAETVEQFMCEFEDKWGFYVSEDGDPVVHQVVYAAQRAAKGRPPAGMAEETVTLDSPAFAAHPTALANAASWPKGKPSRKRVIKAAELPTAEDAHAMAQGAVRDDELEAAINAHDDDGNDRPNPFGAMAATLVAPPAPQPATPQQPAAKPVQRTRDEANGIKRPSEGTICANVWELCASMQEETARTPALSEVVSRAQLLGINQFTARTQYACWRKFNGITGVVIRGR